MAMKKKAAKAVKQSKPAAKKAAPAKETKPKAERAPKVEAVPLDDVKLKVADREHLEGLCEDYLAVSSVAASYEKDKKALAEEIKAETKRLKLPPAVFTDTFKLTVTPGEKKSIQATLLLSLGVSNAIIEKATKKTPTSTLRVTAPGEGDEGSEE